MQSSVFFPFLAFEIIFETQHYIMKKLMFTLALSALVTMGVQAQKQMGGEHNVEVSFTPFSGSPIDGSTIKYRNFMDDDKAFRLSLTMSNSSDVHAWYQDGEINEADPVSPQLNINTKSFNLRHRSWLRNALRRNGQLVAITWRLRCLSTLEIDRIPKNSGATGHQ